MIIYEVTLKVEEEVVKPYLEWLHSHINEMLALDIFIKAHLYKEMEKQNSFKVLYYLKSKEDLEKYFIDYAQKMRSDGLKRFLGKFEATRGNWEEIIVQK